MRITLLLLCAALLPSHAEAQWRLSLAAGPAATTGHSRDNEDLDQPAILPDHPVNWMLGLARQRGQWRIGADAHRLTSDLAVRGKAASVVTRGALSAWGVGVELSRQVAHATAGPTLQVGAGGVFERWAFDVTGGDARWRAAGRISLQLDLPLARRWAVLVRGEGLGGRSLFRQDELPEGYTARAGYSAAMLLGVTLADNLR